MIREPAVAGTFYPRDAAALARTVDDLVSAARPGVSVPTAPTAIVAPHAGYVYSGGVAGHAYASVRSGVRRVALLGPAHFVPLRGARVPSADAWATPLGTVTVDPDLRERARQAGARAGDRPHRAEHALEVQVPFLQRTLDPGFTILPVAVGIETPHRVADLLEELWDEVGLVVVSTDLSHHLGLADAERWDRRTADAVVAGDAGAIRDGAACGVYALRGLVELARRRGLDARLLALATSADAGGDSDRVVGYGAFGFG